MPKKQKENYEINETRYMYCDETPDSFLEAIEFDEGVVREHIFSSTFDSKEECLENQLQIDLEDEPKKIKIKIAISVEEV